MKEPVKKWLRSASKFILFLLLFSIIFNYTSNVFVYKDLTEAIPIIEKQPDGLYDVILAGPSHMQFAIQPAQLFGEYGISSCNVSTTAQSIPSTYFMVKEMIDRHDPELVVVDLFCLFLKDYSYGSVRIHQALDHFPISKNKIAAIQTQVTNNQEEFYIPYIAYHGRWKELTKKDYSLYNNANETYQLLSGVESFKEPFSPVPLEEKASIPDIPGTYLKKIVDLCQQTNTELLLTVIPYRADVDNNETSAIYQQQLYNTVSELAKTWDVDFLNGLHVLDEIGFDFTTDMIEYSHVNTSGTQKITAYYGKYLREHYDLPDRSQDPDYADWYLDYQEYLLKIAP